MEVKELLSSLDAVALEKRGDGRFVVRSGVPAWCRCTKPLVRWEEPLVIEEVFPFLSVFIPTAENAWRSERPMRADSDLWTVMDDADEEPVIIYHSHTATEAYPSRTDIAYANEPTAHYVLVSTREPDRTEFRSFRIVDGTVTEEPVEVVGE